MSNNNNSGNLNSGNYNSGDRNSGNCNSGDRNSGNCNSGNWNSGSGNCNSGNWNSGNWNSGNCNSGNYNSGDRNSGNWNSGNWNSGFFNTDEPTVRMFNKETGLKREQISIPSFCYFDLTEWIEESKMTDDEKRDNPKFFVSGGYLKTNTYKEAFRKSWDSASREERNKILSLPNFDAEIFLEISGIDVRKELKTTITVVCDGRSVEISKESAKAMNLID